MEQTDRLQIHSTANVTHAKQWMVEHPESYLRRARAAGDTRSAFVYNMITHNHQYKTFTTN